MIPGDWANMCQAVWQSPFLPLASTPSPAHTVFGTGARFKRDLLAYLDFYGNSKTGRLVKQLAKHDFSAVRAALIASVPSKQKIGSMNSDKTTLWGWPALKDTIQQVPLQQTDQTANRPTAPHIVIQVCTEL
jgi:tyrosyl-DNA phosphodiesterase-1